MNSSIFLARCNWFPWGYMETALRYDHWVWFLEALRKIETTLERSSPRYQLFRLLDAISFQLYRFDHAKFNLCDLCDFKVRIYLTEKLPRLTWSLKSKWCCTNSLPANLDVRFLSRNFLTNSWAASSSPSCASTMWGWASRNPLERSSITLLWSSKKVSKLNNVNTICKWDIAF